ncbi:MAG: MFS transporter [Deltaproteobacteria bacterium]|jgi:MFS family permease|nr:MFS transporter [Deltaproteobacteria bacterium]MBW2669027.1 MFS transporter [Deltaproteobacteria bacterium]MBW2710537.1 MFS transporter [Deltaproteobacteria bacterium]NOQ19373.1 MFS transporter [Desulfobacterales bacterium]
MIAMFRRGLFYSYLSIYLRHFLGLSVTETTLFATFPMVINIIFQTFVWGAFSDKYQLRRTLIVCGEILAGFGTVLVWYAHTLTANLILAGYVIIMGLSIVEIFWSMSNVGWSALISDIYPQEDRNTIQGRLASVGGIGRIAGVWIGGLLYDGLSLKYEGWGFYEGALFFVAASAMFISIVPMLWVPEGGIKKEMKTASTQEISVFESYGKVFWIFIAAMVFINFGRNSIAVIQSQYLVLDSGFAVSSKVLSYIVNTQSAAMILTGLIAGWIGRKIGNGNSLLLGTVMAIGSLILLAVTGDLVLIYISNFLRGCSEVIVLASSYAFASVLIPPERRAKLFSIYNATYFLSWGIAGTFIAGPITDILMIYGASEVFSYQMAFVAAAIITLIGFIIQVFLSYVYIPKSSLELEQTQGL